MSTRIIFLLWDKLHEREMTYVNISKHLTRNLFRFILFAVFSNLTKKTWERRTQVIGFNRIRRRVCFECYLQPIWDQHAPCKSTAPVLMTRCWLPWLLEVSTVFFCSLWIVSKKANCSEKKKEKKTRRRYSVYLQVRRPNRNG